MKKLNVIRLSAVALALSAFGALARAQYTKIYTFNCNVEGCSPQNAELMAQGQDGNLYGTLPSGKDGWFEYPLGSTIVSNPLNHNAGPYIAYSGFTLGTVDGNLYGGATKGGGMSPGGSTYGALFQVSSATHAVTLIYPFTGGVNGSYPNAPPIQGPDGNLYGTTCDGAGTGHVYQVLPSPTQASLGWVNDIGGCSDAPLIFASDGNLYGTTSNGSVPGITGYGYGGIFQVTLAGVLTGKFNFNPSSSNNSGNGDGGNPCGPLMQANDGFLYGTAKNYGAHGDGVVFQFKLNGAYTVLHNFQPLDGVQPMGGLVQGSDGFLYGLTSTGGFQVFPTQPGGTLFKIDTSGANFVRVFNLYGDSTNRGTGTNASATPTLHTNGKIYGLTYRGGTAVATSGPGAYDDAGELFSYNAGLSPFVAVVNLRSAHIGDTVQIVGQGFLSATGVKFGNGAVPGTRAALRIWSDTYMTATVPVGATTGPVVVTESNGTLSTLYNFTITPAPCVPGKPCVPNIPLH